MGGYPVRYRAFLCTLAEYPDQAPVLIHIVDIKSTQFGDTYTGRIQQFHHCVVTQSHRIVLARTPFRRPQSHGHLFRVQHRGQHPLRPRSHQT